MKHIASFAAATCLSVALLAPQILFADDMNKVVAAEQRTDELVEEVVSTISAVTAAVTPENAADLSLDVSAYVAGQSEFRLIGTEDPIGADSDVLDRFEQRALEYALEGQMTQRIVGGELRTVIPLTFSQSDETAQCATCHGNYNDLVENEDDVVVVGAAAFRVPLND